MKSAGVECVVDTRVRVCVCASLLEHVSMSLLALLLVCMRIRL